MVLSPLPNFLVVAWGADISDGGLDNPVGGRGRWVLSRRRRRARHNARKRSSN